MKDPITCLLAAPSILSRTRRAMVRWKASESALILSHSTPVESKKKFRRPPRVARRAPTLCNFDTLQTFFSTPPHHIIRQVCGRAALPCRGPPRGLRYSWGPTRSLGRRRLRRRFLRFPSIDLIDERLRLPWTTCQPRAAQP